MLASVVCLAQALYYEARSEPLDGQLLVAEVVLNRVKHEDFPDTVCEVIYDADQFSWSSNPPAMSETKELENALKLAESIYKGETELLGSSALYFHSGPREGFFTTRNFLGKYGEHSFYD